MWDGVLMLLDPFPQMRKVIGIFWLLLILFLSGWKQYLRPPCTVGGRLTFCTNVLSHIGGSHGMYVLIMGRSLLVVFSVCVVIWGLPTTGLLWVIARQTGRLRGPSGH